MNVDLAFHELVRLIRRFQALERPLTSNKDQRQMRKRRKMCLLLWTRTIDRHGRYSRHALSSVQVHPTPTPSPPSPKKSLISPVTFSAAVACSMSMRKTPPPQLKNFRFVRCRFSSSAIAKKPYFYCHPWSAPLLVHLSFILWLLHCGVQVPPRPHLSFYLCCRLGGNIDGMFFTSEILRLFPFQPPLPLTHFPVWILFLQRQSFGLSLCVMLIAWSTPALTTRNKTRKLWSTTTNNSYH